MLPPAILARWLICVETLCCRTELVSGMPAYPVRRKMGVWRPAWLLEARVLERLIAL